MKCPNMHIHWLIENRELHNIVYTKITSRDLEHATKMENAVRPLQMTVPCGYVSVSNCCLSEAGTRQY